MIEIAGDEAALARIGGADITALTEAATGSSFYAEGLTPEQIAANRRVVEISAPTALAAAANAHQHFAAAFVSGDFAGYVIATVHTESERELDWLMVRPDFHGSGVAAQLMARGMDWLGRDRPIWLNVLRHNARAIPFYERFGFAIDPEAVTGHAIPHWVMRYRPDGA